jgi:hypothetical protein
MGFKFGKFQSGGLQKSIEQQLGMLGTISAFA